MSLKDCHEGLESLPSMNTSEALQPVDADTLAAELRATLSTKPQKEWGEPEQRALVDAFHKMSAAFPQLIPNTVCLHLEVKPVFLKKCQAALVGSPTAEVSIAVATPSETPAPRRRAKKISDNGDPYTAESFYELLSGIKTIDPGLREIIDETQLRVWALVELNNAQAAANDSAESNGHVHAESEVAPAIVQKETAVAPEPMVDPETEKRVQEGERRSRVLGTIIAIEGWHQKKITYPDAVVKYAEKIILTKSRATDNIPVLKARLEAALNVYDPDVHGAPNEYCIKIIEQVRSEPPEDGHAPVQPPKEKPGSNKANPFDVVVRLKQMYLSDAFRLAQHLHETSNNDHGVPWDFVKQRVHHAFISFARFADSQTREHFGTAVDKLIRGCVEQAMRVNPNSLEYEIGTEIDQSIDHLQSRVAMSDERKAIFLERVCENQFEEFEQGVKWAAEQAVRERMNDVQKWINMYPWFGYNQAVIHIANGATHALWRFDARLTHINIDDYIDDGIKRRMDAKSLTCPKRKDWE